MTAKKWVLAVCLTAALSGLVIYQPIDWCKVEGVCGNWLLEWTFDCDCTPTPQ